MKWVLKPGRIAKAIIQGPGERELSRVDLEKAIEEYNAELMTFGTSVGLSTFDTVHSTRPLPVV